MDVFRFNNLDLENIIILNDELKKFSYDIFNTMTFFIDEEITSAAITINFIYNNYIFDLYNDDEITKLSIINKKNHNYEFYYENHEQILINKCELENVSIEEMNYFIKQLFEYILNNFS